MSSSTAADLRGRVARIVTIAALTGREASRRRLLLALVGLTIVAVVFAGWGFLQLQRFRSFDIDSEQIQLVASQLLILVMFMYSFVVTLTAVFVASPSIAGEIESGQALALLARPIARWELLLGRWIGLSVLVGLYAIGTSLLQFATTWLATRYVPPEPLLAAFALAGEAIVILTLCLVLSTRLSSVTGGIVGLLVFGIGWVGGIVGGIGRAFGDKLVESMGDLTSVIVPTDGIWRATIHALEPVAIRQAIATAGPTAAAFPFYAPFPPSLEYLLYVAAWIVVMLVVGAFSLERRDI